jgi:hypothetical protein
MSSSSYNIKSDAISVGGERQTSGNYISQEAVGEMGTQESRSASYIMDPGFWSVVGDEAVLTFNITKNSANLGTLSKTIVKADTATFNAATTAKSGYVISFYGNSLSGSSHTITPLSSLAGSSPGNEQFGFNLRQNSNPTIGNDPTGGQGQAATGYNTPDSYKFNSGDAIAQATQPSVYTNYTASFISNISATSNAGDYSANLTVVATGRY